MKWLRVVERPLQVGSSINEAILKGETRVLLRECPALCGDGIELAEERLSHEESAVLEHGCSVSKNVVNCSLERAVFVELPFGVCVESVLVSFE